MFKKILTTISAAMVLATSAIAAGAASGPRCTIYTFLDQGEYYMKNIKKTETHAALTGDFGDKNLSNVNKAIRMQAMIDGGIRGGATQRIMNDLALSNMSLSLKDRNGQTFTINLQDATLNAYKYYYVHLYRMLETKDKNYRQQFAAAAIDIADFMLFVSTFPKIRNLYIDFAKTFLNKNIPLNYTPYAFLIFLGEAKDMQKLVKNQKFFEYEFGSITTGLVRGYIVAQRDRELRKYIPRSFLDFAFYVITGNYRKADKIVLKEIQKGGGFTSAIKYCSLQQLKYKNTTKSNNKKDIK